MRNNKQLLNNLDWQCYSTHTHAAHTNNKELQGLAKRRCNPLWGPVSICTCRTEQNQGNYV